MLKIILILIIAVDVDIKVANDNQGFMIHIYARTGVEQMLSFAGCCINMEPVVDVGVSVVISIVYIHLLFVCNICN